MRITHYYSHDSKSAQYMRYDALHGNGDIYDAYVRPSIAKINSFKAIRNDYLHNDAIILGIPCKTVIVPKSLKKLNNVAYLRYITGTLNVCGASSHFYTTCALFEDVEINKRYIVKETHCNTYMCELWGALCILEKD